MIYSPLNVLAGDQMRPRERRETGEQDLFRSRLDQIIDLKHPLVTLARTVDWGFLEGEFGAVYTDDPGRPPLPTRLMAGLAILKHTYDLSDEVLCERWVENPYYQYFCGEEFFQHRLVFDRSSLTRWRNRMGEERLQALMQESLSVATKTEAMKPSELSRVIVDTTVQPKNVTFPTDAKLSEPGAREAGAAGASGMGVELRQSYARVGKFALIQHQRYAHAKQFKRANRMLTQAADLSRPRHPRHRPQDRRRWRARSGLRQAAIAWRAACASSSTVSAGRRSIPCTRRKSNASARARRTGLTSSASRSALPPPSSTARAASSSPTCKALPGNPYDGHTLATVIPEMEALVGNTIDAHPRRRRLSRPQCAARLQVQGLHLRPEATRDAADQARDAPPLRRRARHRPSQGRAPHGPQLSRPAWRCHQRHPRRRRLQLPPPHPVAQAFVAPNPERSLHRSRSINPA